MNGGGIIKLEAILDHDLNHKNPQETADYLLACLTHVTNARPLFGVVDLRSGRLCWSAGGAEFHDMMEHRHGTHVKHGGEALTTFEGLFDCFGVAEELFGQVMHDAEVMGAGAALTVMKPLTNDDGRFFRLVLRKRTEPNDHQVQFTWMDITAFEETAKRTQTMANRLLADMSVSAGGEQSAWDNLLSVLDDLPRLFQMQDDRDIASLAQDMSVRIENVTGRMVDMLRGFETQDDTGHWQPRAQDLRLRPAIAVHDVPVDYWHELHDQLLCFVNGEVGVVPEVAERMHHALTFVKHAVSTMIVSPTSGSIFALNGTGAERRYTNVEDFVRGIGVEENSTRTAVEFFSNLTEKPTMSLFAVGGQNIEAWGRPGLYGGWQAMLSPSVGPGVDVRGLFHGIKNLLLHLQVLYVVKTLSDVDQVRDGLSTSADMIRARVDDLEAVARTGRRHRSMVRESVEQWISRVRLVAAESGGAVDFDCDGSSKTVMASAPGEMEDTFEELARNAFQHGAQIITVRALKRGDHLCLTLADDGRGMGPEKLDQVRTVLKTRRYDRTLTTRKDGTGNGLLAAANAVSRFVDGQMNVDPGPGGRGVQFSLSMKLSASG